MNEELKRDIEEQQIFIKSFLWANPKAPDFVLINHVYSLTRAVLELHNSIDEMYNRIMRIEDYLQPMEEVEDIIR